MGILGQIDMELQKDLVSFIKQRQEEPGHTLGDYLLADILKHIIDGDARLSGCATNHETKKMWLEVSFYETEPPAEKPDVSLNETDRKTVLALEHCMNNNCDQCPWKTEAWIRSGNAACQSFDHDPVEVPHDLLKSAASLIREQRKIIDQYHKADTFLNVHGWNWEEIDDGR